MKDLKMCVNSFNDANELNDDMKTLKDHGVQGRRLVGNSLQRDLIHLVLSRNIYRMVPSITGLCLCARLFTNSSHPFLKIQFFCTIDKIADYTVNHSR